MKTVKIQSSSDKDVAKTSKATFYIYPTQEDNNSYEPKKDSYYAPTAYTGVIPSTDYYAKEDDPNDYIQNRYKRLCYVPEITADDYIANTDATNMYTMKPDTMDTKGIFPMRQSVIDREYKAHEIEYFFSSRNLASFFYLLAVLGHSIYKFFTPIMIVACLIVFAIGTKHSFYNLLESMQAVPITFIFGLLFYKINIQIAGKLPDDKFIKLNRRTGMVCFPQKGKKPDIEIPFSEYEPRSYLATGNANMYHKLVYVHKTGKHTFSAGQRVIGDVYTKAAYLEQFMDITKPLPDIPPLEWCRDKDPTTAHYDKKTNRDTHYWRNKTYDEIEGLCQKIRKKIKSIFGDNAYRV